MAQMGTLSEGGREMTPWPWYLEPHLVGIIIGVVILVLLMRFEDEFYEWTCRVQKWCQKGKRKKEQKTK